VSAVANQQLFISVLNQELNHNSSPLINSSSSRDRASVHFEVEETSLTIRPRTRTWAASEIPKPVIRRTRRPSIAINLVEKTFVDCRKCVLFLYYLQLDHRIDRSFKHCVPIFRVHYHFHHCKLELQTVYLVEGKSKH
jgi:hypothetical protein